MKLETFFARHPIFTYKEVIYFMATQGQSNLNTQRELIAYHCKVGNIVRIRKELFTVAPKSVEPEKYIADPYLIAGRIIDDAVLTHHTAIDFYGYAYSIYSQFNFLSHQSIRNFNYQGMSFHCLPFPKALVEKSKENFAVNIEDRAGLDIKVTSLERTIVDCLDKPQLAGGWEEIWRSLDTIVLPNLDKLITYAFLLNNASLNAKVGFYLEQQRDNLDVEESCLNALQKKFQSKSFIYNDNIAHPINSLNVGI